MYMNYTFMPQLTEMKITYSVELNSSEIFWMESPHFVVSLLTTDYYNIIFDQNTVILDNLTPDSSYAEMPPTGSPTTSAITEDDSQSVVSFWVLVVCILSVAIVCVAIAVAVCFCFYFWLRYTKKYQEEWCYDTPFSPEQLSKSTLLSFNDEEL